MASPHPGQFLVANYETSQPAEVAYERTPYCWIVETRYHGPTNTKGSCITADLANRPGRQRHRHPYHYVGSSGENHTEAALQFMRAHVLEPGADARLVSMASSARGFLFVFI